MTIEEVQSIVAQGEGEMVEFKSTTASLNVPDRV